MSDRSQFPPPVGRICRLLVNRFGIAGQNLDTFRRSETTAPLERITLLKESLFVIIEIEKSSYTPQTNWERKLTEEKVQDVLAEVLCDSYRCIIILSPDIYELAV
jgi:hypothetical protein